MASAPFQIIAGPADVYLAPVGTEFPTIAADPADTWTWLGRTQGGVVVTHTQTIVKVMSDQLTMPIKAFRSEELLDVEFSILELTLENYARILNNITVNSDGGSPPTRSFKLARLTTVNLETMLVRGPSPYGDWNMQYEVPVCFADENPAMTFSREKESALKVKFSALADLTQDDDDERYGVLRAEDS